MHAENLSCRFDLRGDWQVNGPIGHFNGHY